jgi:hypothetical protein
MRFFHTSTSVYLGRFRGHDLYFDSPSGLPTVVARFGPNSDDYRSGLFWSEFDPVLSRAKELAFEEGFICNEDIDDATDIDDEISSCPQCHEVDEVCHYHMEELKEHYACVLGMEIPEDEFEHSVCVH